MFISESWQLGLRDESVFPAHIGSQFKHQPYGTGHICHSPLMAHIPMLWMGGKWHGAYLQIGNDRERERGLNVECLNPFMSYTVQCRSKSNVKPSLTPGYNVPQRGKTPPHSHFPTLLWISIGAHPPAELFLAELMCSGTAISLSFLWTQAGHLRSVPLTSPK